MDSFFSGIGISAVDFVDISSIFLLTMIAFFGLKEKHRWLKYLLTATSILIYLSIMIFRSGINLRLYAALTLISTLVIQGVVSWRKKHADVERQNS